MFTASEIVKLCGKKGLGDTGMTYIYEKVAEILTGERKEQISSKPTEWGNMWEKGAFEHYISLGYTAEYYGKENFVFFEYNKYSGGSPDGLFENGVLEIKCPYNTSNHIQALHKGAEWLKKNDYYYQLQFNMMCAKRDNGRLISFDPRIIDNSQRMAIIDVQKDEEIQNLIDERVTMAANIVTDILNSLTVKLP